METQSLNLATFVSTWMDDYAKRLYAESYDKNMIDKDEYPETAAIEKHCTKMIAKLWNAPGETIGTSTIGSMKRACSPGWRSAPLATRPQGKGSADRQAESSSRVLRSRLSGRSSATTGKWNRGTCRSRLTSQTSPRGNARGNR